jgi:hypothetical protein
MSRPSLKYQIARFRLPAVVGTEARNIDVTTIEGAAVALGWSVSYLRTHHSVLGPNATIERVISSDGEDTLVRVRRATPQNVDRPFPFKD